ncbi:MAG: hypothetical protein AB7F75_06010 [Planctomycetota bacterium]
MPEKKRDLSVIIVTFLIQFIAYGAIGGGLGFWLWKKNLIDSGKVTQEQWDHCAMVLEMKPDDYKAMVELLKSERRPVDEREKFLFEERDRFAHERTQFENDRQVWAEEKNEELTRLRAEKQMVDAERRQLDTLKDEIVDRERLVDSREKTLKTEMYTKYIAMLQKMTPADIGRLMAPRAADDMVQDLSQLKSQTSGEVLNWLLAYRDSIADPKERDGFSKKMLDVHTLLRDGGLRGKIRE